MNNPDQAREAFERMVEDCQADDDRERDVRLLADYLANCEITFRTLRASANYQLGEHNRWFAEASRLDTEIKGMRVEVGQSRAELAAVAISAHALCDCIEHASAPSDVVALAGELRAALNGQRTEQLAKQISGSVGRWEVVRLAQILLRKKMQIEPNLAEMAEKWFRERVIR